MAYLARYLTHPQVKIDPTVPVPSWGLSALGRARTEALANTGCLLGTTQIISSGERKAIETAEIIAGKLNVVVEYGRRCTRMIDQRRASCRLTNLKRWPISFLRNPLSVSGDGKEQSMPSYVSSVRSSTSWLTIEQAMCSSSAMVPSVRFYSVTMQALRLIEPMINPLGAVTASHSSSTGVACCIHGFEWKTCREGVTPVLCP